MKDQIARWDDRLLRDQLDIFARANVGQEPIIGSIEDRINDPLYQVWLACNEEMSKRIRAAEVSKGWISKL